MAPFTGGCHYSWDCTGYQRQCGSCPGLHSTDPHDLTYRNFTYKQGYFDKTDIRVISGSEGQYRELRQSTLFKHRPITKILLAVNPDVFKPVPSATAREKFGIAPDRKVIFFGAVHLENKRKGIAYLVGALKALKASLLDDPALDSKITLLVAGQRFDEIENDLPFPYHYLGMLRSNGEMATAYQAADVFVCPSLQDAGPTMINQSLMCGTPVVAFETGVGLDLVITGTTGYRAELRNSEDMAEGIKRVLSLPAPEMEAMRKKCRAVAEEMIHPEVNLQQWINVIKGQA
jgi:glycosyltransferase involved in cell wall biosynthesis